MIPLGIKIEEMMKNKTNINAKEIMYRLAKEQSLLEPIKNICDKAREIGSEQWTDSGLIRELGREIKVKNSKKK